MRILLAGATGAIGRRLVPLLTEAGHAVTAMTRSPERAAGLAAADVVMADALDAEAVRAAVARARPDAIIHQLTDLGGFDFAANSRLRIEGTRNLVDAAKAAGVRTMVAQSIAWLYAPGDGPAVESDQLDPSARGYDGVAALEAAVAEMPRGVVLRYGLFHGPGTWYAPDGAMAEQARAGELPATRAWASFVHVEDAAAAALAALDWPAGPVNVVAESVRGLDWVPAFAAAVGAPPRPSIPPLPPPAARSPPPSRASAAGAHATASSRSPRRGEHRALGPSPSCSANATERARPCTAPSGPSRRCSTASPSAAS